MCGVFGMIGHSFSLNNEKKEKVIDALTHRGPDGSGSWSDSSGSVHFIHTRLSIVDRSEAGKQPFISQDQKVILVFNGEIYNFKEIKRELRDYQFKSNSDTEVIVAAYKKWGIKCIDRFLGMFSFLLWDDEKKILFAVRDRFGVKPLYLYQIDDQHLLFSSEIKVIEHIGIKLRPDEATWATYLVSGRHDDTAFTFWEGLKSIEPGTYIEVSGNKVCQIKWYDLEKRIIDMGSDTRDAAEVEDELDALLQDSIRLRLQAEVDVGCALSGGVDSRLLYLLASSQNMNFKELRSFTFYCNSPKYDELDAAKRILGNKKTSHFACLLSPDKIPKLMSTVTGVQREPFGGLATLGMFLLHQVAREKGVVAILNGNGLDEAWAGYEYYQSATDVDYSSAPVQGSKSASTIPNALMKDFASLARPIPIKKQVLDPVTSLQVRDLCSFKIPRALRFLDRVSMMNSTEAREPFLDHRLIELGVRQPIHRKISATNGKIFIRNYAQRKFGETTFSDKQKQVIQTPQREWLRDELSSWADENFDRAMNGWGGHWFSRREVEKRWKKYKSYGADNSFFVWQWISLGAMQED